MWKAKMQKTYKYRLMPTGNQARALSRAIDVCRTLYNSCLLDRNRRYEETGKGLSRIDQQVILEADKGRVKALSEVHSQVLQDVLFRVERAYQGFFRRVKAKEGKAGYPRFKGENRYDSITYPQEPGFLLTDEGLRLSKIGTIKIKLHRPVIGQIKTCTIKREVGKWYACFSVNYDPVPQPIPVQAVGIDLGIKSFAILSDGTAIANPKHLRVSEKKLATRGRQLSKKKKGSNNRRQARIVLARLHQKVRNQRSDFHHKVSRDIVNRFGFIAVEDLNIRGMVRNHHLAKSISDAGWGQFLHHTAYKAEEAGCRMVWVDPQYTSVDCSVCGKPVPKTLAQRTHRCPFCGTVMDRDHNAARNILQKALRATVGTTESYAWGESQLLSLNQEAPSVRAG
jgi:putative transposase